jgi:hypothetical protein
VPTGAAAPPSTPPGVIAPAAAETRPADGPAPPLPGIHSAVEAGGLIQSRSGRGDAGGVFRITARDERILLSYGLAWAGNGRSTSTMGLAGCGIVVPLGRRWDALAVGLGGFDLDNETVTFLPAVGAQLGVEWRSGGALLRTLGLSITVATDLVHRRDAAGETVGGSSVSLSATAGMRLGDRP